MQPCENLNNKTVFSVSDVKTKNKNNMFRSVRMWFCDLCEIFFDTITGHDMENSKLSEKRKLLKKYAEPFIFKKEICDIDYRDIREIMDFALENGGFGGQRKIGMLLREIFNFAKDVALIDINPCSNPSVHIPALHKAPGRYCFTEQEVAKIFEAVSHNHLKFLFALMLGCGLTGREAINMKISDYHPEKALLDVKVSLRGERQIQLGASQVWFIEQEIERQKKMEQLRMKKNKNAQPALYLFGNYRGNKLSYRMFLENVRLVRRNSGVPRFSPQNLRNYFIIKSIREGNNPFKVFAYADVGVRSALNYLRAAGTGNIMTVSDEIFSFKAGEHDVGRDY